LYGGDSSLFSTNCAITDSEGRVELIFSGYLVIFVWMNRSEQLSRLSDMETVWDIIVIGGGATGLGIALDAASRGYRTALLEQADFAEGTSSKSTKLIHGGVRYLRSGEVGLVRESLRERGRLLKNGPNLVTPLAFVVPAYRWYERFFYGVGLFLYDLLAGRLGIARTGFLSARKVLEKVPNLRKPGLYGGTLYWDGQFDDSRLALAIAKTAVEQGAAVVNHVRVEELIREDGKIRGVVAKEKFSGTTLSIRGSVVINATGVFSDTIRQMDEALAEPIVRPSQGIHLVLDRRFLGGDTAVMIPNTEDGRVLFAIPWMDRVLLGTTDTDNVPASLHPMPMEEEIDYLIRHAALYLTEAPDRSDVLAIFAGLRPLVQPLKGDSGSTAQISRSHSLFVSEAGLLTVAGGKWTTYRQMAEDAVDRAALLADLPSRPCVTADLTLLDPIPDKTGEHLDPSLPYFMSDVDRAVADEMAMTLDDVLSRRTRAAFLDEAASLRCARRVAERISELTGRDDEWIEREVSAFSKLAVLNQSAPTSQSPSDVVSEGS
jgi:glycerol-3-phosphate dehydrogenase